MKRKEYISFYYHYIPFPKFTRSAYRFDENGNQIKVYPPFVYDYEKWQAHWEEPLGVDEEGKPFALKDIVYFPKREDIHEEFLQEMTRQLTPIINAKVGVEVQNFETMFSINTNRPIYQNGYSYLYLELVTYGNGILFWIKWKSLREDMEYIPMSFAATSEDVRFEICETLEIKDHNHPEFRQERWIESIREIILPRMQLLKGVFPFALNMQDVSWPDVHYAVRFRKVLSEDDRRDFQILIGEFLNN